MGNQRVPHQQLATPTQRPMQQSTPPQRGCVHTPFRHHHQLTRTPRHPHHIPHTRPPHQPRPLHLPGLQHAQLNHRHPQRGHHQCDQLLEPPGPMGPCTPPRLVTTTTRRQRHHPLPHTPHVRRHAGNHSTTTTHHRRTNHTGMGARCPVLHQFRHSTTFEHRRHTPNTTTNSRPIHANTINHLHNDFGLHNGSRQTTSPAGANAHSTAQGRDTTPQWHRRQHNHHRPGCPPHTTRNTTCDH